MTEAEVHCGRLKALLEERTLEPINSTETAEESQGGSAPYAFQPPRTYRLRPTQAAAVLLRGSGRFPCVCSCVQRWVLPTAVESSQTSFSL